MPQIGEMAPGNAPETPVNYRLGDFEIIGETVDDPDFGPVHLARNRVTGEAVTLRRCRRPDGATEEEWTAAKRRLRAIIEPYAALKGNPHLLAPVAVIDDGDATWVAEEHRPGPSLRRYLQARGTPVGVPAALKLLNQIGNALEAAARLGLAHTGLHPERIYVVEGGDAVLVGGWGVAHLRERRGSPYAPPELWDGMTTGDPRADVWAAGALLYEMLSGGRPAFWGRDAADLGRRLCAGQFEPLSAVLQNIRDSLAVMLSPYPSRRFGRVRLAAESLYLERPVQDAAALANTPPDAATVAPLLVDERFAGLRVRDGVLMSSGTLDAAEPVRLVEPPWAVPQPDKAGVGIAGEGALPTDREAAEVDQLVRDWRAEKKRRRDEEAAEPRRRHIRILKQLGVFAALVGCVALRANSLMGTYGYATVASVRGRPQIQVGGKTVALNVGDRIDAFETPTITTGKDASVVLQLRGARLKVAPGSALQLRQLDYQEGPVRRFGVEKGQATFSVRPLRGVSPVFEVACRGVRTGVKGTRFRVGVSGDGRGADVATAEGAVRVGAGAGVDGRVVAAGKRLVAVADGNALPESSPLAEDIRRAMEQDPDLNGGTGLLAFLGDLEEKSVLGAADVAGSLAKLEVLRYLRDTGIMVEAKWAVNSICTHLMTGGGENIPPKLNAVTLAPLSMERADRARLMRCFKDGRLLYYKPVKDGFEFAVRANDTRGTVIKAHNMTVTVLSAEESAAITGGE